MSRLVVLLAVLVVPTLVRADGPKKYEVQPGTARVKLGEKGKATLRIQTSAGSHVSDEAPLKIALTGDGVKLEKQMLHTEDIADGKGSSPRFDVAVIGDRKGPATVTADMTFIVCTKELCEREQEKVTIPVTVE